MTLERHRSHLIPQVGYGRDGTLMVTDTGGTFPLRGKGKNHKDVRGVHGFESPEPAPSFRSYDPRRDDNRRRYKQRPSPNHMSNELQNLSGYSTISTQASSLGRRLRRSKRKYSSMRTPEYRYAANNQIRDDFKFKENGHGSMTAGSTGRRLRTGTPRMTPEFAETLRKNKSARSLNLNSSNTIKRESPYDIKRRNSMDKKAFQKEHRNSNGSIKALYHKERYRKIHDEKLPYIVFLIDGILLMVVGIIRVVMSYWHENYCALWAGLLAIILGIIGAKHGGLYLAKHINAAYVFMGFLVSIAMLVTSGFVLRVLVPTVTLLASSATPSDVITQVTATNMNRTLTRMDLSLDSMIWTSVALDLSTLILVFVGFFSLTAALIALSNHWDATYDTTADCDHRGNPRLFNPIEQSALGEATLFTSLIYVTAETGFSYVSHDHFYLPTLSGALVMLSGLLSFCFGKRTDMLALGTFACLFELLSFGACCGATILITLGIVEDVTSLQALNDDEKGSQKNSELLAIVIIGGAVIFVLAVNIIFVVGTVFRHFRQVCCRDCCSETSNTKDRYDSFDVRRSDKFNSMDRRR